MDVLCFTDGYWCPSDFRRMSLGWYLNHSETPTLIANGEEYIAARDILPGEELTIDYGMLDAEVDNSAILRCPPDRFSG